MVVLLVMLALSFGVSQLLLHSQAQGGLRLEILQEGRLIEAISLPGETDRFIKVESGAGRYNVVEIDMARVRVKEAECPNQICVHTGWISQPGQVVICAPNKLALVIKGGSDQVDAVAY